MFVYPGAVYWTHLCLNVSVNGEVCTTICVIMFVYAGEVCITICVIMFVYTGEVRWTHCVLWREAAHHPLPSPT